MKGRVVSLPALPRIRPPIAGASAEHISAHDVGTDVGERLAEDVIVRSRIAIVRVAVDLAKALWFEEPVMDMVSSFAKGVVNTLGGLGVIDIRHTPLLGAGLNCVSR